MTKDQFLTAVREGLQTKWRVVQVSLQDCAEHCDSWGTMRAGWVVVDGERVTINHHYASGPDEPERVVATLKKKQAPKPQGTPYGSKSEREDFE